MMTCYPIKSKIRKYVKGYGILSFTRNLSYKYGKQFLNTASKTGPDAEKFASKK